LPIFAVIIIGLTVALIIILGNNNNEHIPSELSDATPTPANISNTSDIGSLTTDSHVLTPEQIFANNVDAVFLIVVFDAHWNAMGTGSGFFVSPDGVAVTNHHVIVNAQHAVAITENGMEFNINGYYSYDVDNDLAVIQVEGRGFPYLDIGDSSIINVGEPVYTIGSPQGEKNTFEISYISRFVPWLDYGIYSISDVIQITAPIYGGSSGGALLNGRGEVVGVTSAMNTLRPTVGFAVPISRVNLAGTQSGQYLPLPVGVPAPAPGYGLPLYYSRFSFIPDFLSVSRNAEFILGGFALDLEFYLGEAYNYDYVYIYSLDYWDFVPDTDAYDVVLMDHGFILQDILEFDGSIQVYFYHPGQNASLLYVYLPDDEMLLIAVGWGNAFEILSEHDMDDFFIDDGTPSAELYEALWYPDVKIELFILWEDGRETRFVRDYYADWIMYGRDGGDVTDVFPDFSLRPGVLEIAFPTTTRVYNLYDDFSGNFGSEFLWWYYILSW